MSRPLDRYTFAGPVIILSGATAYVIARSVRLEDLAGAVRNEDVRAQLLALLRFAITHQRNTAVTPPAVSASVEGGPGVPNRAAPTQHEAPSTLMDTGQAARTLALGEPAVRAACRRGRLPAVKLDGKWRIEPADLAVYGRTTR